jgi:DNA-binding transcriptional ArsR family regulator
VRIASGCAGSGSILRGPADRFEISVPAISQHLKVLKEAHLVRAAFEAEITPSERLAAAIEFLCQVTSILILRSSAAPGSQTGPGPPKGD